MKLVRELRLLGFDAVFAASARDRSDLPLGGGTSNIGAKMSHFVMNGTELSSLSRHELSAPRSQLWRLASIRLAFKIEGMPVAA